MPSQHKTPNLENSIKSEEKCETSNEISSLQEFCKNYGKNRLLKGNLRELGKSVVPGTLDFELSNFPRNR